MSILYSGLWRSSNASNHDNSLQGGRHMTLRPLLATVAIMVAYTWGNPDPLGSLLGLIDIPAILAVVVAPSLVLSRYHAPNRWQIPLWFGLLFALLAFVQVCRRWSFTAEGFYLLIFVVHPLIYGIVFSLLLYLRCQTSNTR